MPRNGRSFFLFAALLLAAPAVPLPAQATYFPIEGYINAVYPPHGFEANGRRFEITPETAFGPAGTRTTATDSPLRETLRIGVYVQVAGRDLGPFKPIIATTIIVRDDWNRKLSGVGVITRVLSPAPMAVFEADGYLIRITPSTDLTFLDELNSLSDVTVNTWIHFSGKLGKDGILEAAKAQFMPAKPTKFKAVKILRSPRLKLVPSVPKTKP